MNNKGLTFSGEWFQEEAGITRLFKIYFYPEDNSIEIFDKRLNKLFLRRTQIENLKENDFMPGNKVNVFGRMISILDYADDLTRNKLGPRRKKTFMLIRGSAIEYLAKIIKTIYDNGFNLTNGRMVQFNIEMAKAFFGKEDKTGKLSLMVDELLTKPSCGLEIIGDNAINMFSSCSEGKIRDYNVNSTLLALFEEEKIRSNVYCSNSEDDAVWELKNFFKNRIPLPFTTKFENSTLALIKPHIIKEGKLGHILTEIVENGFKITALRMQSLEKLNCQDFYEVYQGVLPEYGQMVTQLSSGLSMAIEIVCKDELQNTYEEFRKLCGPLNPEIAKHIRPRTLRALFGHDKVLNAIHCTDLPDDVLLELEYFFRILD